MQGLHVRWVRGDSWARQLLSGVLQDFISLGNACVLRFGLPCTDRQGVEPARSCTRLRAEPARSIPWDRGERSAAWPEGCRAPSCGWHAKSRSAPHPWLGFYFPSALASSPASHLPFQTHRSRFTSPPAGPGRWLRLSPGAWRGRWPGWHGSGCLEGAGLWEGSPFPGLLPPSPRRCRPSPAGPSPAVRAGSGARSAGSEAGGGTPPPLVPHLPRLFLPLLDFFSPPLSPL